VLGAVVITASTPILENTVDLDPSKATFAQMIVYGSALVLFMMFRPEGILRERHHGTTERKSFPWRRSADPATAQVPAGVGADVNPDWDDRMSAVATKQTDRPTGDGVTAIKVRGLVKHFGGIKAVNGVDLDLPLEKVTALIGPNGAGKSTLFGLFTGFIAADQGTIEYRGQNLRGLRPDRIANLGVVRSFQDTRLFRQMTALENVMSAVPGQAGESLFKLYFLPWKVSATNEPTSGIDEQWANHVAETIKRLPEIGKTVCIVEHNLAFLERLEVDCYFLEAGAVRTKGTLRELMANDDLRKAYFAV
jgi:ABC-type branched-subunit amino acid transport system ATPase component